jgi:hypothetical protein
VATLRGALEELRSDIDASIQLLSYVQIEGPSVDVAGVNGGRREVPLLDAVRSLIGAQAEQAKSTSDALRTLGEKVAALEAKAATAPEDASTLGTENAGASGAQHKNQPSLNHVVTNPLPIMSGAFRQPSGRNTPHFTQVASALPNASSVYGHPQAQFNNPRPTFNQRALPQDNSQNAFQQGSYGFPPDMLIAMQTQDGSHYSQPTSRAASTDGGTQNSWGEYMPEYPQQQMGGVAGPSGHHAQ